MTARPGDWQSSAASGLAPGRLSAGLVSVIVPVYNRPKLLEEAVASALGQTYRPIEVLIIDDGSTDDTREVAAALAQENTGLVRLIYQENAGPGVARETGRLEARGEFIQYLDSDDLLLPRKLEIQVERLKASPEAAICYGVALDNLPRVEESGSRPLRRTGETIETILPSFLVSRWWTTECPLYRRAVTDAAGPWLATRLEEDWEYDCRIGALGVRLVSVAEAVCVHRDLGQHRLSRGGELDPNRLRDRFEAHRRIFGHAQRAHVGSAAPEMARFARQLFLLCRQCGAAGLSSEARELFELSRSASTSDRASGVDFRLFHLLARVLGWRVASRIARARDWFRMAAE